MRGRNPKGLLLVVLVAAMVNLPVLAGGYTSWRVDRSGTDTTAAVTAHRVLVPEDPRYFLEFTLPDQVDPDRRTWVAEVDHATYERAVADGTLAVRVLPGRPQAHAVEGEVAHRSGLWITLAADAALLLLLLVLWRFRGRLRPQLRAVAVGDLEPCDADPALDRVEGDQYLIRGEVSRVDGDEVVLDLGGRSVRVLLDGHHNPVAAGQPAQVRARLTG